ncbi:MAG: YoaK family protein [Bacteriovoracaceae bacterium]
MIHVDHDDVYKTKYVWLWLLLSFKAGFLNAGGFLATGKFVSHITGFGTQVGIALGDTDYTFGIELLVIPISFILGAAVTAMILEKEYARNEIPPYPYVQLLITLLIGLVAWAGSKGSFGKFFQHLNDYHTITMIALLCFICGLKNSLTTWATQGKIRTTHITGLATDLGLNLHKFFTSSKGRSRFREKRRINFVRLLSLFSFSGGSLISTLLFPRLEYEGFYIVFIISIFLTVVSFVHRQKKLRHVWGLV